MSRFRAQSWTADGELNIPRRNVQHEVESRSMNRSPKPRTGPKAIVFTQGKTFFLLLVSWILFVLYIRSQPHSTEEVAPAVTGPQPRNQSNQANFHLLVYAPQAYPNLCRFIVSAAVTGYPSPIILNWGSDIEESKKSPRNKIDSINNYLSGLDTYQDDDLVLLVDGYDTWMQLRPQTLLDRYFEVIRTLNARVADELGRAASHYHIRHDVVFSSQKRCSSGPPEDPSCYAAPQSALPDNIYGSDAGQDSSGVPHNRSPQRFLHSGSIMGTVRAMREIFAEAQVVLQTKETFTNIEQVFGTIFGDQQLWREVVKRDSWQPFHDMVWSSKYQGDRAIKFNEQHIEQIRAKAAARENKTYEFGIGLDYQGLIGFAQIDSEPDTAWLTWGDSSSLRAAEEAVGVPPTKSRLDSLSRNVSDTVPPFWTFHNEKDLSRWTGWEDIPLLTNVWTGQTPAMILHDAHRHFDQEMLQQSWRKTWYFPHARILYDASIYEPILPLGYSEPYDTSDPPRPREYWPFERWKGGGRNAAAPWDPHYPNAEVYSKWLGFEGLCGGWPDEIFMDGKGIWLLPKVH